MVSSEVDICLPNAFIPKSVLLCFVPMGEAQKPRVLPRGAIESLTFTQGYLCLWGFHALVWDMLRGEKEPIVKSSGRTF